MLAGMIVISMIWFSYKGLGKADFLFFFFFFILPFNISWGYNFPTEYN